ncbi:MAG: FMN-binding negative transcriptional regulator [Pontixanthobacter sp.]
MHPSNQFRASPDNPADARALQETLVDQIGFGMIFADTPDGPRVAHTPLLSTGDGAVQFHLSRGNALTKHLTAGKALLVVNGPDAYVSARWYEAADQVPTWNYVALELEGTVRRMDADGLLGLLEGLSQRHEDRITGGQPWTMDKMSDTGLRGLLKGIVGFEMEVLAWRDTVKLSQNKSHDERARVIAGLEANGAPAIAALMRSLVPGGITE